MSTTRDLPRRFSRRLLATTAAAAAISIAGTDACALTINSWTGYPGTDVWGNATNWNQGNVPNSGDQATIYAGPTRLYSAPASIGGLLVSHIGAAGQVFTNGFKLNVLNSISLDGTNAGLYVDNAPSGSVSVQSPLINLTNGGLLDMETSGGKVRVSSTASGTPNGTLSVDATSTVIAYGTIDTDTYTNNGLLRTQGGAATVNANLFSLVGTPSAIATIASYGQALTINATTFKLHDPNTKIDASSFGASISLQGSPDLAAGNVGSDVFVGDSANLTLGVGTWLFGYRSKSGAIFVDNGSVNLNGGTTLAKAAKVTGYGTYFTSLNVSGYGSMTSGEFDGGCNVNIAANSYLYVGSPYFRGTPSNQTVYLNGPGTIQMNGDTAIGYAGAGVPYSVVNVAAGTVFNWDGTGTEANTTCTIENGELDINTNIIDVQAYIGSIPINNYGYDGTISIDGTSKLNVAGTAWTLFGTMKLGPGALVQGQTMTVDGSSLAAGTYSMYPGGSGGVYPTIQAPMVLKPNSVVYMASGSGLNVNGATTYAGGLITTAPYIIPGQPTGTIVQNGDATVTGSTSFQCNTVDMDGAANTTTWTISPGATLDQQAYSLDTANSTTNPFRSTMNINGGTVAMSTNLGFWTLAGGTINMNQSGINLPFVTHDKLVLGTATTKGTVNVGASTTAYMSGGIISTATSVAGGNVINVGLAGTLYVGPTFTSTANARLTKSGPGRLVINATQSHSGGVNLDVIAGELDMNTDAGAGGANLALNLSSGATAVFGSTQRLSSLAIPSGATAIVTPPANPAAHVVISTALTLGGKLDLTGNDLIVHGNTLATIGALVKQGYNGGGWNGSAGISSSSAAASGTPKTALGFALNNDGNGNRLYTTFDGQSVSLTDVLVKYTLAGDADLSGTADFNDLLILAKHFNASGTTWVSADFNFDGQTNFDDLLLLAKDYGQPLPTSATAFSELDAAGGTAFVNAYALALSSVPEPTTLAALGMAGLTLARRRRLGRSA